jgi:4-hydroxy-3-methylbut-2-enyl diphosphate reductase
MSNHDAHEAEILLAQPRGFCAGVDRAISIVNQALEQFGAPIYVRHEIVHNKYVVDDLRNRGAIFIDDLAKVPEGATLVFSAHGVPPQVKAEAQARGLHVFDATCPLVTKVHVEVVKMYRDGYYIVMIGHKGHPEVEGTMGQVKDRISLVQTVADVAELEIPLTIPIAYVTQTTLSIDETADIVSALKNKFPQIAQPKKQDICYATQNRQDAVKLMAPQVQLVIVVGSPNSSNSNRLWELSEKLGVKAYMVDHPSQLKAEWFEGIKRVGLTAGASAPEVLAQSIIDKIKEYGPRTVRPLDGVIENTIFQLPKGLNGNSTTRMKQ